MYFYIVIVCVNTMTSMINTNVFFFDFTDVQVEQVARSQQQCTAAEATSERCQQSIQVREIFMIHVGGTRCVTSSTDQIMKIHARIPLTVECIRTCIFIFFIVCVNTITSTITTNLFSI